MNTRRLIPLFSLVLLCIGCSEKSPNSSKVNDYHDNANNDFDSRLGADLQSLMIEDKPMQAIEEIRALVRNPNTTEKELLTMYSIMTCQSDLVTQSFSNSDGGDLLKELIEDLNNRKMRNPEDNINYDLWIEFLMDNIQSQKTR